MRKVVYDYGELAQWIEHRFEPKDTSSKHVLATKPAPINVGK